MAVLQQSHHILRHLRGIFRTITDDQQIRILHIESISVRNRGDGCLHGHCTGSCHSEKFRCIVLTDTNNRKFLCHSIQRIIKAHSDHIGITKQRFRTALRNDADFVRRIIIGICKIASFDDRILVAIFQSCFSESCSSIKGSLSAGGASAETPGRCYRLDIRDFLLNGIHILFGKYHFRTVFCGIVAINCDLAARHRIQFSVDPTFHSITYGDDHDHRRDSYDNAQHGQDRTSLITADIHQCNFDVFPYLCHGSASYCSIGTAVTAMPSSRLTPVRLFTMIWSSSVMPSRTSVYSSEEIPQVIALLTTMPFSIT